VAVPTDPRLQIPFVPAYWERLWSDSAFQNDLQCRWRELRRGPLRETALHAMLDGWVTTLLPAQPRDAAVWGNPPANAYAGEVATLKAFLSARATWMDANLPGRCVE
jgi:hypothetical protein